MDNNKIFNDKIDTLESDLKNFPDLKKDYPISPLQILADDINTITSGYYNGLMSIGVSNSEMKFIGIRLKTCQEKLLLINFNRDADDGKTFFDARAWLGNLIDEINRWSADGHYTNDDEKLPKEQKLIKAKQQLAALELEFQNSAKPGQSSGTFMIILGVIIVIASMPTGALPLALLGLLVIVAGVVKAVRRSDAKNVNDELTKKMLTVKNKIIELENS